MEVFAGTSGYSYGEWKGAFYPETLSSKEMLRFYGQRLPSVEVNNTFYRMPKTSVIEGEECTATRGAKPWIVESKRSWKL